MTSLLYAMRPEAVPIVAALMEDPNADRRYYATLLALDFADPALLEAAERRLFDDDTDVVALAMQLLQTVGGAARVEGLGVVIAMAVADPRDPARVARGIELASALRHPRALEALIGVLDGDDSTAANDARSALRRLTGHDAGGRAKDWAKFVRSFKTRSRYTWLLEGLVGKEAELRDLAAAELALLTGRTLDYRDGCSLSEAKAVRRAYEKSLRR